MPPRVAVVIPNWNGRDYLQSCLASLREQSFQNFETIVVDNGSTDGSVEFVNENSPEVEILSLGRNRGFSVAVNAGIRFSNAEFVVLLNNDTEQDPRWLESLVDSADTHVESGFFASKLVSYEERDVLDGAGDALRLSGLPYRLGHGERDRGQFDKPAYVFGACAAAALYRRKMLEVIGLFDENFFAYCEDGDLSFRAQLAGYRCRYVPEAVVYHMGSVSTGGKRSRTATYLGTRNSLLLLAKNLPTPLVLEIAPFLILGQLSRLVFATASGVCGAHLSGVAGAVRMLPAALRGRRQVQKRRQVPLGYVRRLLRDSSRMAAASIVRRIGGRVEDQLQIKLFR